jgi:aspartyl-tRNA(Asn)/glutamyl-tRNA(Gln) amidotransferase subunit A
MHSTRRTFAGGLLAAAGAGLAAGGKELPWLTLEQAAEMVRRKQVSPVELTQACLARIEKLNPSLNAFITVTAEQALSQARVLEKEMQAGRPRGPLHGIPIALKDLIDTAGIRTTAGSEHYAGRVPSEDAEVVRRLKAAGAVLLGKLNMDEFAYNFTAETSYFGPSRNPWDQRCSPGGSSGGSAVAVASGMCFAALGSDTGGSIRLPAALCGITGLKGTYGRVSTRGAAPLAWSLDHVGPMCRTARDAAWVLAFMAGRDPGDPATLYDALPSPRDMFARELKSLRLGVPRAVFYEKLDPRVDRAVADALKILGAKTAGFREVVLPPLVFPPELPELPQPYLRIIAAEAYAFHEDMLKRQPGRYNPGTRKSIEGGASVPTAEYIRARREMDRLRAESGRLFADADLLLTPAAPEPTFEFGRRDLVFLRNSAPWNLYGLPSISIPCGFADGRLPVGIQITGPAGREDLVLALAGAYQQATDWHTKRPPV